MPNTVTTTIAGKRFDMILLGGRDVRAAGAIVTPAIMKAAAAGVHPLVAIGQVLGELGPKDLETVTQTFFEKTTVFIVNDADPKNALPIKLTMREDVLDKWTDFLNYFAWAIAENDFLGPLAALAEKAAAAKAASASPPVSTGSSGGSPSPTA